jgi:SAM-dependent MidA family methyltransferase
MRTPIDHEVADRIRRRGPIPFAEVMELALYDPEHGFYARGGAAGRRGDFITSSEVGPLFGALIGRTLDRTWHELGEPDPFVVIEAGAGVGTLARSVIAGRPECAASLTYVLVERSTALRARHGEHLPLVEPLAALDADGDGPRVVSLGELPPGPLTAVILANELLDNLPVSLVEWHRGGWHEVRVGLRDDEQALVEQLVPAPDDLVTVAAEAFARPVDGVRVPVARAARAWLDQARATVERGRIVLFDYGEDTTALAARPADEWLRTYRAHERGGPPLFELGSQDITCEVPWDQVTAGSGSRAGTTSRTPQAEFLRALGIDGLVAEGRAIWHERAHLGDLEALRARSRVREAEALLDPTGLGAFTVVDLTI